MTNRIRIAVMALSAAIVAVGASALRTPEAHAARLCTNTACQGSANCAYQQGYTCVLTSWKDSNGQIQHDCMEGPC